MLLNNTTKYYGKPDISITQVKGGLNIWSHTASNSIWANFDFAPLDSLQGPIYTSGAYNNSPSQLIPVNVTIPAPAGMVKLDLYASDPLVNKFPGDWRPVLNSQITLPTGGPNNNVPVQYATEMGDFATDEVIFPAGSLTTPNAGVSSAVGDNPGYRPINGGDPLSVWAPPVDINMPKLARFPSVGALNSIRTGIIPDMMASGTTSTTGTAGVPWRSLCFASSTSLAQQTASVSPYGGTYPDWAMLDLFTVPFVQQPLRMTLANGKANLAQPQPRLFTYGGATQGRLNINNPQVPYPFSAYPSSSTWTPPQRTAPLQALFYGIQASTSYDSNENPVYTTVDSGTDANSLFAGVQTYLNTNGPFMLPGELANVPAVNNYTYTKVAANAQSRNDLMRQVVGAVTTQSNTYSIWVVAQTINKNSNNSKPGQYQAGDGITGEVRRHYIVERYIDTGSPGIPVTPIGINASAVVPTGSNPTWSSYPIPYRWRILSVEDVTQ
jgi:hypothetical protein